MSGIEEYRPGDGFPGKIARTVDESSPAWPAPARAREGAPNVLFFVLDDVGYGQLSSFGGLVETPNIDRVAAQGLRYANMHTTALCSPTRSCILTGRNHHSNGVACIMELATGYPGYDGRMPFENGMLPEMLLDQGYNTFCLGKWHLSPSEENTPAGPFHRWPLGRGFERFYGFLGGENQWYPDLTQDNTPITQPRTGRHDLRVPRRVPRERAHGLARRFARHGDGSRRPHRGPDHRPRDARTPRMAARDRHAAATASIRDRRADRGLLPLDPGGSTASCSR